MQGSFQPIQKKRNLEVAYSSRPSKTPSSSSSSSSTANQTPEDLHLKKYPATVITTTRTTTMSVFQHFYAVLHLRSPQQYPFSDDLKANICNTWKTHKCFSFLKDTTTAAAGKVVVVYFMTMFPYPMSFVQQKLELPNFINCTDSDHDAVPWTVAKCGGLVNGLDDAVLQELVPFNTIDDEKYLAERWTLRPLDSAQSFGSKKCQAGTVIMSFLESDRVWDCHDKILFEFSSDSEKRSNEKALSFAMMFTTSTGIVSDEQMRYLMDFLSIYCAESVKIGGIFHMCMQLNEKKTMKQIRDIVYRWNVVNPQNRITIIRQDGCFQPVTERSFLLSSFYTNCIFPRTHDSTRMVWC